MARAGRRAAAVGGPVGGLFAANPPAKRGWDVRAFERAAAAGGRAAAHPR